METVFASFTSSGITVSSFLLCSLVALLCGALIAFTYTRRTRFTQSLVLAVILLPFAVQTVIMLVNGNVGTGVAVAGAFGLVRFRSAPGNAKDISVIFVAMAVGLACGSGYIALSVLFTVIACAVLYLLVFFHIGADRSGEKSSTSPFLNRSITPRCSTIFSKNTPPTQSLRKSRPQASVASINCTIVCALRTTATKKNFSMRFAAATAILRCAAASRILPWNSCKERSLLL